MTMVRTVRPLIVSVLLLAIIAPISFIQSTAHSSPLAAKATSDFGVCSHIASRYPTMDRQHIPANALEELGVGWAREDFQMYRIAKTPDPADYNWDFFDGAVQELRSRDINIVGVLVGPTPRWATPYSPQPEQSNFYPPSPNDYATFVYNVVNHYKSDVHYWEIWNEPDNPIYWQPRANHAEYVELLKAGYSAVKNADPSAQVLLAGVVSPSPADELLKDVHRMGGWGSFDIISLHPYTDPYGPEEGNIGSAGVAYIKDLADKLGAKPIWVTEFGWSTGPADRIQPNQAVSEQTQADYLVRGMMLTRMAGAEKVLHYALKDTAYTNLYGVIGKDGGDVDYSLRKIAFGAIATMNKQLAGTTPVQMLDLGQRDTILNFEHTQSLRVFPPANGSYGQSGERNSGSFGGEFRYNFTTGGNDYAAYLFEPPLSMGSPNQLQLSVKGDGSGHAIRAQIRDSEGELYQFRLGFASGTKWQALAPVSLQNKNPEVLERKNGQLDYPLSLAAIVIDDQPDSASGSGSIFMDDLIGISGPAAYGTRFSRGGNEVVDVLWATQQGVDVPLWTNSAQGTQVDLWGTPQTLHANGGKFVIHTGTSPVYVIHTPGTPHNDPTATPQPTTNNSGGNAMPAPGSTTTPTGPQDCFDATGYCMFGRIRDYWHANGGLAVFGYPITPQREEVIEGKAYQVQWFERNRLELHPENAPPYDVLLGRLSEELLLEQNRVWQLAPQSSPQSGCRYFTETGYNVCGNILAAWHANGLELDGASGKTEDENIALFGLPLGDAQMEVIEGKPYFVQWFERARFEVHPENAPPYNVLLGLLGNEMLGK